MAESQQDGRLVRPVGDGDHALGPVDAAVTVVEYGDYECPYTALAHPFLMKLRETLGDQLRLVYRYFPLTDIHPHARRAAEAAEAAAQQGAFWEMHAHLLEHHEALAEANLRRFAGEVGLDGEQFQREMAEGRCAARVGDDIRSGEESGVHGTPTFFINGRRHESRFDLHALHNEIYAEPGVGDA